MAISTKNYDPAMSQGADLGLGGSATLRVGSGVPAYTAAQGSLFVRTDGSSTSTRLYVNTTGSNVWTNLVTAA